MMEIVMLAATSGHCNDWNDVIKLSYINNGLEPILLGH